MTPSAVVATSSLPWYRDITGDQWRILAAAKVGWMLDAMDFMLYAMAVGQLRLYFGFNDATAGLLGTATLLLSGVGGLAFGYVGDRFGRTRALMITIIDLFPGLARRRDGAVGGAADVLAGVARHRHGRRVGVRCGARQRDVAGGAPEQGDQHHAVRMGDRLHPGRRHGRGGAGISGHSGARDGGGCSRSGYCRRCSQSGFGGM